MIRATIFARFFKPRLERLYGVRAMRTIAIVAPVMFVMAIA
jgi:hypothetical protein